MQRHNGHALGRWFMQLILDWGRSSGNSGLGGMVKNPPIHKLVYPAKSSVCNGIGRMAKKSGLSSLIYLRTICGLQSKTLFNEPQTDASSLLSLELESPPKVPGCQERSTLHDIRNYQVYYEALVSSFTACVLQIDVGIGNIGWCVGYRLFSLRGWILFSQRGHSRTNICVLA